MKTTTARTDALTATRTGYSNDDALRIARMFRISGTLECDDFRNKGNIHGDTFLLSSHDGGVCREYLLQRINHHVFTRPRSVMAAMMACTNAQKEYLAKDPLPDDEDWQVITLIPTLEGAHHLELTDERGIAYWRMMERIQDTQTFQSLSELPDEAARLRMAEQAGKGLAMYGDFTSGMDISGLDSPLPGYRDTRLYYSQFKSVLAECRSFEEAARFLPIDPVLRQSTEFHFMIHIPHEEFVRRTQDLEVVPFIKLALDNEEYALSLLCEMEAGAIRTVAIHGDTKLDNFLFCKHTRRVKALVDLDTIMPHSWLADWGDMVRSLVNVVGEKEPDIVKVQVNMDIFRAVANGFLSTAREITPREVELMVDAVRIIALELGVRFLMDYLRGDSYFKLGSNDPPDLNRTRGMVQLTLFERLGERAGEMNKVVREFA
jgi:hypothetical protein